MHDEREKKILAYWNKEKIFQKSLEKDSPKGDFVFYDGPPFATGVPHYGSILPSAIKDAIPRYKTMQGYRVRRRWGWDCHGLPVENLIEKELGLSSKKDILTYGIDKFNKASRESVMRFADEWRKIIPRVGRWVDMDNDYRTMDSRYTESVWWAFKRLHEKGLIYEGFKSMQICPHCETTLSNFEVAQGYKDIADLSVYVKCELVDTLANNSANGVKTYLIAWTTTPWTLPGNAALAINSDTEYVTFSVAGDQSGAQYIVAKSRLEVVKSVLKQEVTVVNTIVGKSLIGRSYKPIFPYYSNDQKLKGRENGWKIYAGDFVTTEDGTGIVHIAPAFGADDYALSLKYNIPFIQHVSIDGKFKSEVTDFSGMSVKPRAKDGEKDAHQKGDVEIIKYLAHNGLLFAKEKITHSYPHCWRCETPLLNYATSSWFVKVTAIKDKLVSENKKVAWVPPEIGQNRFGDWLENARDWAISRARFWGAPIPVWRHEKTGALTVMGSIDDIRRHSKSKNTYIVMRHGEAESNVKQVMSTVATDPNHLTDKGKQQAHDAVAKLKSLLAGKQVDHVYISPFVRTRETTDIITAGVNIPSDRIVVDSRIAEFGSGVLNSRPSTEFNHFFEGSDWITKRPDGGESYTDVRRRMGTFIYDIEAKYDGKTILIITHDSPAWLLYAVALGIETHHADVLCDKNDFFLRNAEVRKLDFAPLPHNDDYEVDLHRPYIDNIALTASDGAKLVRVPEVFDCWFESGSMPYAECHYPFDKKEFDPSTGFWSALFGKGRGKGYPADFIAEGLDQTRGWFYSMLVLGVALFGKTPYKRVIVNGLILAEDGQKMSKSKKNYPDPDIVITKYGADALRYYLLSSPVVKGQDFCFSERGVDEVAKKHIGRLLNVVTFYEMFAAKPSVTLEADEISAPESRNPLDKWILARLCEVRDAVTSGLDKYELDVATRPFADFIDDLSTWYLRRSRDRFKGDDEADRISAMHTTKYVLSVLAQLLAPFMPFLSEEIYMRVNTGAGSVHLSTWPTISSTGSAKSMAGTILAEMSEVRRLASLALEARSKAKINVRQPLSVLKIRSLDDKHILSGKGDLLDLIKDEVNVESVAFSKDITEEISLDTNLTPELKEKGMVREIMRAVQDARKTAGLSVSDRVKATVSLPGDDHAVIRKYQDEISKATGLSSLDLASAETLSVSIYKN